MSNNSNNQTTGIMQFSVRLFFRSIEVEIRYFLWILSRLKNPTTYDKVVFKGEEYFIKYGNPYWIFIDSHFGKKQFKSRQFKVVRSLKRDFRVFKHLYGFQKRSWYSIDVRNNLFSRISYKGSDNIKFRDAI